MLRRACHVIHNITKNPRYLKRSKITCRVFPKPIVATNAKLISPVVCNFSNNRPTEHVVDSVLDHATYEKVCTETMDGINDYFEELLESVENIPGSDISYSDGVLTVKLGSKHGTYVINRQTPNRQIWLSSPTSGPKRYDFAGPASAETGKWVYRHTGLSLHELLQHEIQKIFKDQKIDFENLPYAR